MLRFSLGWILHGNLILGLGFPFHLSGEKRKGTTGGGSVEAGTECGASFSRGDDQNPPGFDPVAPAGGEAALAGLG